MKWTLCEDELPKKEGRYLVVQKLYSGGIFYRILSFFFKMEEYDPEPYYDDKTGSWQYPSGPGFIDLDDNWFKPSGVLGWMPIPPFEEFYKEG